MPQNPGPCIGWGVQEGRSPFAGGTGVSPVFGFLTPFLARACPEPVEGKGDRGMVERAVGHQRRTSWSGGFQAKPAGCEDGICCFEIVSKGRSRLTERRYLWN